MQEWVPFLQKNIIWVFAWVGLAVMLAISVVKQLLVRYRLASPQQATLLMNQQNGVMLDLRSKDDFRKGHIAGAMRVSATDLKNGKLAEFEAHKSHPVILVCKTGQTAIEAATILTKAGFEQVFVLENGLISWNEAKLPLIAGSKK
ncbi:MAG: rhodanese-like domain-containing protein [Vibrionaceae bacterium]